MVMWIGVDDTDSPEGMCTTYLGAVIRRRLEAAECAVREMFLIRLNPTIIYKTRGNAAVCIEAEGDPKAAFEIVCRAVEELAMLDHPCTNPGVVVASIRPPPEIYQKAVTDICNLRDALEVLDATGALYRGYGNSRGLIGATAAVAADLPDRTYELLAYRKRSVWGSPRRVDPESFFVADRMTAPHTWDTVDRENDVVVAVPHTPDPVLFGIRGESPEWVRRAASYIRSEEPACTGVYTTNQGTDAHLLQGRIGSLSEGRSYRVSGYVSSPPVTGRGGHVTLLIGEGDLRLRCMAYEPTKGFRNLVRRLIPGDLVEVCGSYIGGSLNLEKFHLIEAAPAVEVRPPVCPVCGKRMTSAGTGKGYKCRRCGRRAEDPVRLPVPRELEPGWYEVPPVARRHLSRPLIRG
ncbi:MAG: TiaS agmantine-binding domain-containing protein [Methanoculleaceae archaeon]